MENTEGYLLVYFTGEGHHGEQVYFSLSSDGLHWKDLNRGFPVLISEIGDMGVRDPFILRTQDKNKYYIIATDLRIEKDHNWERAQFEGSRSIILWESENLLDWSQPRSVEIGIPGSGCVWAPEAIYNRKKDNYLIFWASMVKEDGESEVKQRIYYSETKNFITFTKAKKYIERENHIIDTTIMEEQGYYYRIAKNESTKNITMERGKDLFQDSFEPVPSPALEEILGVEGPAAFQRKDGSWCLMVDRFVINGGYLPMITNRLSEGKFELLEESEFDMGVNKKRHGSVLRLNKSEYTAIKDRFLHSNLVLNARNM